jgi:hypothetical protein
MNTTQCKQACQMQNNNPTFALQPLQTLPCSFSRRPLDARIRQADRPSSVEQRPAPRPDNRIGLDRHSHTHTSAKQALMMLPC